jgi:hypothetical protein
MNKNNFSPYGTAIPRSMKNNLNTDKTYRFTVDYYKNYTMPKERCQAINYIYFKRDD